MPIHARQFVLGPNARKGSHDWKCLRLRDRLVLSYCPRLWVRQVTDKLGRCWVLLGMAVQSDSARGSPEDELADFSRGDIASVTESWAGRWILIGEDQLYLDAGGLLGCYYLRQGGFWLSSSLALLTQIGGQEDPGSRRQQLADNDGLGGDPPPRCCYRGIGKLLPTQRFDLRDGSVQPRQPFSSAVAVRSYEELLAQMADCLTATIRNVDGADRQLWVALSAGYHSRLLLAAALRLGVDFRTYTQTFPMMLEADRDLPVELAQAVGVEHFARESRAEVAALGERMDAHSHGQYVDVDRTFYARRQWEWSAPADVMLRGLGLELGQCYYWHLLPDRPAFDSVLAAFGAGQAPDYVKESLADYLDWTASHPIPDMDWRDRWYLDMRLGGWLSAEEQALDLLEGRSFIPANSARLYRLLLQVPVEVRRTNRHFIDLIDHLWPGLTAYPFNARDSFLRNTVRRVRKYAAIIHHSGARSASHQLGAALRRRLHRA